VPRRAVADVALILPRLRARDEAGVLTWLSTPDARPTVAFQGMEIAAMVGLVAAGEGLAVLPSALLDRLSRGETVVRLLEDPALPWSFGLMWRGDQPTPMAQLAQRQIRQMVPKPVVV